MKQEDQQIRKIKSSGLLTSTLESHWWLEWWHCRPCQICFLCFCKRLCRLSRNLISGCKIFVVWHHRDLSRHLLLKFAHHKTRQRLELKLAIGVYFPTRTRRRPSVWPPPVSTSSRPRSGHSRMQILRLGRAARAIVPLCDLLQSLGLSTRLQTSELTLKNSLMQHRGFCR